LKQTEQAAGHADEEDHRPGYADDHRRKNKMFIDQASGILFFTPDFWQTAPALYTFLFVPQAWSLGLELLFYFIAPFLLRMKRSWIIAVMLASLALRLYLYNVCSLRHDPWTYRFFPTEIIFFLAGNLSYRIYKKRPSLQISRRIQTGVVIIIAMATILYGYVPACQVPLLPFSVNELVYFTGITMAIPVLSGSSSQLVYRPGDHCLFLSGG
jgi:peptidoglycan/LPS O-acetylase OafA/YrhL